MRAALAAWMQGERTGRSREQDAHGALKGPEQPCDREAVSHHQKLVAIPCHYCEPLSRQLQTTKGPWSRTHV